MWTKIKSVYKETGKVQRAFLWFGFGMLVSATFSFPIVMAAIAAIGVVAYTIMRGFNFIYSVFIE